MKTQISSQSLTFTQFFLALAYCLENIEELTPKEERELVKKHRIRSVFLPPIWDVYNGHSHISNSNCRRQEQRAFELIEFLRRNFFNTQSIPKKNLLCILSSFFDVFSLPGLYVRLSPYIKSKAGEFFDRDRELIQIAAGELLRGYVAHREEDRSEFGEITKTGFGLVLSLSTD